MNEAPRKNAADLLADILQKPVVAAGPATPLGDIPGWDSLMMVRLMLRLEEHAGRELSEAELESIAVVGDVQRLLG